MRWVEAKTGKIITTLSTGHDNGSKIRSIWCGMVDVDGAGKQEVVVSGGFDRRLIVWKAKSAARSWSDNQGFRITSFEQKRPMGSVLLQ